MSVIKIENASENNLKHISLEIPKNKLVVVTGVSGSGKSSLVYDVIYREAENRYLRTFSSHARQFLGKMKKPEVEKIEGLSPAIAVNQKTVIRNPRSTVGTITGIYDYLRLLFARAGKPDNRNPDLKINRNLFSFNSPAGACPKCNGLGVQDRIDPDLIVADETKSLREGAFVITAPNGYIIYSQVTMDVLDEVCRAEGFSADIPWKDLTPEQKHVVFYGSEKIEIPFGKHTLESRMKWSGITAKPRDTGFYKGVINVMNDILKRDRNKNILRFVRTENCDACDGKRLNPDALAVSWQNHNIAGLAVKSIDALHDFLSALKPNTGEKEITEPLIHEILKRTSLLQKLGCGYLQVDRESTSLSGGESQRLRLATQVTSKLRGVLYIFDEPSIGLHPSENSKMLEVLKTLRYNGNTVIVVEHDDEYLRHADHVIDIGPKAGTNGGEVLANHAAKTLQKIQIPDSQTLAYLNGHEKFALKKTAPSSGEKILIRGATSHNLKKVNAEFILNTMNVVTGVSGAGKSTLTENVLARYLKMKLHGSTTYPGGYEQITGWEQIKKVVMIDQSPIGRTPRSNPATYTKLSDHIRDLYANQPDSKNRNWKKGRFSFNVAGGRCEKCQGAGFLQVGMHFLGDVEIECDLCNGKRFNDETLEIQFEGKNISEVLDMPVEEAVGFFSGQPKILRIVSTLHELGLGYLKLGQRSTTLSGGEAQRIKLATELARPASAHTLYILDEPTVGLHNADVKVLLKSLNGLINKGHTVIVIEHHPGIIAAAGHIVDLGPGSGKNGGNIVFQGTPEQLLKSDQSITGLALREYLNAPRTTDIPDTQPIPDQHIQTEFKGITTHNLKNIHVEIPQNKITVITGVSGSGKSSLAFDTLYAEGRNRFLESFSPYVRSQIGMQARADFEEVKNLTPVIAINRQMMKTGARSTVGTMTGIYDLYRLMFSRVGHASNNAKPPLSSLFSFNHQNGACPHCEGLGEITVGDPEKLITNPELSLGEGAMKGHKWGKFYGDPYGQYIHTLNSAGARFGMDFAKPWNELSEQEKNICMFGTGDEQYDVTWKYKRGKREGEHNFSGPWKGFVNLVNDEYQRKHADSRGDSMLAVMKKEMCPACRGTRLKPEALSYRLMGKNIAELSLMSTGQSMAWFKTFGDEITDEAVKTITKQLRVEILEKLAFLHKLGLDYLSINRDAATLSGGEAQRVRLASQLGNGLTDVTFVLDEPTVGLHPSDTESLMDIVKQLRDSGNTVVMVEHDRDVMLAADHIIELGPGAGENGGAVTASGTCKALIANPESISGQYLEAGFSFAAKKTNHNYIYGNPVKISAACANNLKNISIEIPVGRMTGLTGVSGSGKSSLLFDVVAASAQSGKPEACQSIVGLEQFKEVITITQAPVSTSKVSNVLTFTGLFDKIRNIFANTQEAKSAKLKKSHFSFNSKGGRCEKCLGQGKIRVSMDFVSDVWVTCEACHGKRYTEQVLAIRVKNHNIFDVLEMTVSQAIAFFGENESPGKQLKTIEDVGLGYLRLGQSTDTFSGGELQRLKLAKELMSNTSGKNLYLLDEPSTGLHFRDVDVLMKLFDHLLKKGHTLIIIEHNMDIISQCDYVIDLGPGGGENGGNIVAQGAPESIITTEKSTTGQYLKSYFNS